MPSFAFIVDNVVEYIMPLGSGTHVEEKWTAALRSNIIFVDTTTHFGLGPGDLFIENKFYRNIDGELIEIKKDPAYENPDIARFSGIIDGEVVGMRIVAKANVGENSFNRFKKALSSNPLVVEIKEGGVEIGWGWDGQNFNPPVQ